MLDKHQKSPALVEMQERDFLIFMKTQAIFYNTNIENTYIDSILKEIYRDKIYHQFLLGKEDLTIVDIGANIGLTSSFFSRFASVVHSVEPSQQHYECLTSMIAHNGIKNIKTYKYAILGEKKDIQFYHNKNVTMFSSKNAVSDSSEFEKVQAITLEDLFKEGNIDNVDLLKLDVEGAEFDVLCTPSFANVAPQIKSIIVEYHSWSGRNPGQLVDVLEKNGFAVTQMKTDAVIYVGQK